MYLMKIQINFYVLKRSDLKNQISFQFKEIFDNQKILRFKREINQNIFIKKKKTLNKTWQLHQELEIIKHLKSIHASSNKINREEQKKKKRNRLA